LTSKSGSPEWWYKLASGVSGITVQSFQFGRFSRMTFARYLVGTCTDVTIVYHSLNRFLEDWETF